MNAQDGDAYRLDVARETGRAEREMIRIAERWMYEAITPPYLRKAPRPQNPEKMLAGGHSKRRTV